MPWVARSPPPAPLWLTPILHHGLVQKGDPGRAYYLSLLLLFHLKHRHGYWKVAAGHQDSSSVLGQRDVPVPVGWMSCPRWVLTRLCPAFPSPGGPDVPVFSTHPTRIWNTTMSPSLLWGQSPRCPQFRVWQPCYRIRRARPGTGEPQQPDGSLHLQASPGRGLHAAAGREPLRRAGKIPRVRGAATARARVRHAVQRA